MADFLYEYALLSEDGDVRGEGTFESDVALSVGDTRLFEADEWEVVDTADAEPGSGAVERLIFNPVRG